MRYRVGTKLIPFLGNGHGEIIDIKDNQYVIAWKDMTFNRIYTEEQFRDIILVAKYRVKEPLILDEELFTL